MTTLTIETVANRGSIATADLDIKQILRRFVIQDFFSRVGEVRWRHVTASLSVTAGTQQFNLPDDFERMCEVYYPSATYPASDPPRLAYIGDDPLKVAMAEIATAQAKPSAYYIVRRSGDTDNSWRAVKFSAPSSETVSLPYEYISFPNFTDDTTSVDLNKYIPEPLQGTLISGLRYEILLDRYGQKDNRVQAEQQRYLEGIELAKNYYDLARPQRASFMN